MTNAYLYVFTSNNFDQNDVGSFLDTLEGIETWFYSMPNSVFIVGSVPARTLSKKLRERFGQHRHFVTLISKTARDGWLPKDHWPYFPRDEKKT
jgi:hypothetical protein